MTTCTERASTSCVVCSRAKPGPGGECTDRCRHRRVGDGYLACAGCQDRIAGDLRELLEDYVLLAAAMMPGSAEPSGAKRTKAEAAPLPLRLDALQLRHDQRGGILAPLEVWEKMWREDWDLADPEHLHYGEFGDTGRTLAEVVRFLLAHLPRACREHPAVDEFAREVRDLHSACKSALGEQERAFSPGPCPAPRMDGTTGEFILDDDDQITLCGARLRSDLYGSRGVWCPDCGAEWPAEQLARLREQIEDPREATA